VVKLIPGILWPWNIWAAPALLGLQFSGGAMNILDPQGPIGAAEKTILIDSLAIMLAIVVPTIIAIFAFAFWFRASNAKAIHWPNWEYSGRIELVVWSKFTPHHQFGRP
jgi:heme/copper-type cytochrome/quinol oxidase subunit 2